MCNGPGQEGLHIWSRSIVTCGSNHRTNINVTVSFKIAARSSRCGSGLATGRWKTGRSIELRLDTSKKQTASVSTECVCLFDRHAAGHIVLSFLLSLDEQRVTAPPRAQGRVEGILCVGRPEDFVIISPDQLLPQRVR